MKRTVISLLMILALLFSLTGCGASNEAYYDSNVSGKVELQESSNSIVSDSLSESPNLPADRKLIRTVRMEAETEDLTGVLTPLEGKLSQLGGYLQEKEIYQGSTYRGTMRRSASLVIRVPAKELNSFLNHLSGTAHVVSSNETVEDVTLQYIDVDSMLTALKTEEERLLAMMEKAETLGDLLAIEERLTQVQQEIQSVGSQLKALESQIEYATVRLTLTEVVEYTPVEEKTTWQKIGDGFMDSISDVWNGIVNTFVFLVANSPRLVVWGGILVLVIWLIRRIIKRKKVKKNPPVA